MLDGHLYGLLGIEQRGNKNDNLIRIVVEKLRLKNLERAKGIEPSSQPWQGVR